MSVDAAMGGVSRIWIAGDLGGARLGLLPGLLCLPLVIVASGGPESRLIWLVFWAALMAGCDLCDRRIPNKLNASAAVFGLVMSAWFGGLSGLADGALGGLVGFGLMAVFFFMGAVGGGDVKALAALSVFVGPSGGLSLFVLTCLLGGLMAVVRIVSSGTPLAVVGSIRNLRLAAGGLEMPYALAIFGATVAHAALAAL